jgi:hypothetical protein
LGSQLLERKEYKKLMSGLVSILEVFLGGSQKPHRVCLSLALSWEPDPLELDI